MTLEQKQEFFRKLDQLVASTGDLRVKVEAQLQLAAERDRASELAFNSFMEVLNGVSKVAPSRLSQVTEANRN